VSKEERKSWVLFKHKGLRPTDGAKKASEAEWAVRSRVVLEYALRASLADEDRLAYPLHR